MEHDQENGFHACAGIPGGLPPPPAGGARPAVADHSLADHSLFTIDQMDAQETSLGPLKYVGPWSKTSLGHGTLLLPPQCRRRWRRVLCRQQLFAHQPENSHQHDYSFRSLRSHALRQRPSGPAGQFEALPRRGMPRDPQRSSGAEMGGRIHSTEQWPSGPPRLSLPTAVLSLQSHTQNAEHVLTVSDTDLGGQAKVGGCTPRHPRPPRGLLHPAGACDLHAAIITSCFRLPVHAG